MSRPPINPGPRVGAQVASLPSPILRPGQQGVYLWSQSGSQQRKINLFGLGKIELRVLRDCHGEFTSEWLPERKGQDAELEAFLAEAFLAGLSRRDLPWIKEKHLGQKYDSKQVSRIVTRATKELQTWRQRSLRRGALQVSLRRRRYHVLPCLYRRQSDFPVSEIRVAMPTAQISGRVMRARQSAMCAATPISAARVAACVASWSQTHISRAGDEAD